MKKRTERDDTIREHRRCLHRIKVMRYGGCCEGCGRPFNIDALQIHHVVPISEAPGMALAADNIRLLCPACHARAHGRL